MFATYGGLDMHNLKYLGYAIVAWGFADVGLSWVGTDVWYDWLGITVPEAIWPYTGWAAMILGYGLVQMGQRAGGAEEGGEVAES